MTMSHTFKEDMSFHGKGIEVALVMEVPRHNVKKKNVKSSPHDFIKEVATHVDDHGMNSVRNNAGGGESNAHASHSGRDDHVATNIQKKDVANIPVVNASSIHGTEEMNGALGTIELGNLIKKDQKWIPTISTLTYVAEGDYSTD